MLPEALFFGVGSVTLTGICEFENITSLRANFTGLYIVSSANAFDVKSNVINGILNEGAKKASLVANKTLLEVKKIVGLYVHE